MKLIEEEQNLLTEGISNEQAFKIQVTGKSFEILSARLYSNTYNAILREISCNCIDSHIMAGKPNLPFNLHLPSLDSPELIFEDFGVGLSEDEVRDIYTVLFCSNKVSSNSVTGALGLGSKSIFGYSDSFVVRSTKNGIKTTYSCYKNQANIPTCVKLTQENVTENNGVKITIPIKKNDCIQFLNAAKQILPYLMIKPTLTNKNCTFQITSQTYKNKGKDWGECDNQRPNSVSGITVIMGGVCYPISAKFNRSNLNQLESALLDTNIDIFCEIGDVDIEPSREGLKFSDRTINIIKRKLAEITKHLTTEVEKQYKDCKTPWEVWCHTNEIKNNFNYTIYQHLVSNIKITLNGKQIKLLNNNIYINGTDYPEVWEVKFKGWGNRKISKYQAYNINPAKNIIFIEDDNCKHSYARVKYYLEQHTTGMVLFCKFSDPKKKQAFCELLGINNSFFIQAGSLPKKPRVVNTILGTNTPAPRKKTAKACLFVPNKNSVISSWQDSTVDLAAGGYYVELDRHSIVYNNKKWKPEILQQVIECLELMKIVKSGTDVLGMRKVLIDKVKISPKWTNVFDFFWSEFDKFDKNFNLAQKYANYNAAKIEQSRFGYQYHHISKLKFNKLTVLADYLSKLDLYLSSNDNELITQLIGVLQVFGKNFSAKPNFDLTSLRQQVMIKYPFLVYANSVGKNHVVDYVNSLG